MPGQLKNGCHLVDAEFDGQFGAPGFSLSGSARAHLEECARCRKLYDYLCSSEPRVFVPPEWASKEWTSRVEKALRSTLKPVKPAGSPGRIAAALFLLFVAAAFAVSSLMDKAGLRLMSGAELAGIAAVSAGGAALVSFSLAWLVIPGSLRRVSPNAVLALLGGGFVVATAALFPWMSGPAGFVQHGLDCFRMGVLMAVPAAGVFWMVLRRGVALEPAAVGAMSGALAGLLAVTILQAQCEMQEATHLLVWHGGVLAVSIAAGWAIGRGSVAVARRRG